MGLCRSVIPVPRAGQETNGRSPEAHKAGSLGYEVVDKRRCFKQGGSEANTQRERGGGNTEAETETERALSQTVAGDSETVRQRKIMFYLGKNKTIIQHKCPISVSGKSETSHHFISLPVLGIAIFLIYF